VCTVSGYFFLLMYADILNAYIVINYHLKLFSACNLKNITDFIGGNHVFQPNQILVITMINIK